MKILLANPFFLPYGGGIEYHMEGLVKNLGKEHQVSVMTSRIIEVDKKEEYDVKRVNCISATLPIFSPPPFVFTPSIVPQLIKAAKEYDLIHLHTRWFPDYVLGSLLANRLSGKPIFLTAHEPAEFGIDAKTDLVAQINDFLFTRPLLKRASLFSVSKAVAGTFEKAFGKQSLKVVYNGVDSEKFRPNLKSDRFRAKFGVDSPYILYVGRLVKQKAVDNLVSAFGKAETDLKLVILGRGSEEARVKKKIERLGLEKRIIMITDFLSDELLVEAYSGCEFFVLPSKWEAFGIVLAEAMACEKPCIGTDTGGIPEVVGDGGIIVPKDDVDAFSQAIELLWNDNLLKKTLGKRGRRRVEERFTWANVAKKTLEGYEKIVGEK